MMKNKFSLKLNQYFLDKVSPDIIIEFIYKNVYELIDEIPFIPSELGRNLKLNYNKYFFSVIEKSEENYLLTLFPNPTLCKFFSFSKMYTGLVGRLFFFNPISSNSYLYYFYGDPCDWSTGQFIYFDLDQNKYYIKSCNFLLFKKCSYFQIIENANLGECLEYIFVIIKSKLKKWEEWKIFYWKNLTVNYYSKISCLSNYKEAVKQHYNLELGILWNKFCRNKNLDEKFLITFHDILNKNDY